MTGAYCRFLSIFQLRERQHLSFCFVPVESLIMLKAINRENGGTHDTNLHVYEHTGKKFMVLCVCEFCPHTNLFFFCVCVHKYICKNAYMCVFVCVCVCASARAF
jgi:hypothetical protein